MSFVMYKSKSKYRASVFKEFVLLTDVQWDISDLPFLRNKDYANQISMCLDPHLN